jgi:aminoglycoside phosphotransferase (APT) family kinase protein
MTDSLDIISKASQLRLGVPCTLSNETPWQGGSRRVFKLIFKDSVQWAARIPYEPNDWKYELHAIKQFQHIKEYRPEIKAPTLFFEEEHPVLYSEWVSGKPLEIWNLQIPSNKRQRLLYDLAEFLLQLWTTPGPSPGNRLYSDWLTQSLDRGLKRTLNGTARWGNAIDYLIMRSMIPEYAEFDKYTAIGYDHGDLNAFNIMIDDFHLTG